MGYQVRCNRVDKKVMANSVSIKEMLARFSLSPNQALGQNFLADAAKAQAIAGAACAGGYPILELGPGLGALTEPLLDRGVRLPGGRHGSHGASMESFLCSHDVVFLRSVMIDPVFPRHLDHTPVSYTHLGSLDPDPRRR